jgi:hypothetical protein
MSILIDPLSNKVTLTQTSIGLAILERGDVKDSLIRDIRKTIVNPACIYECKKDFRVRYYFQFFKSTIFMCIARQTADGWYLDDTLFNPERDVVHSILLNDNLLYSRD